MGKLLFMKNFISSPKTIGSITPSSKRLARTLIKLGEISNNSIVVELGSGTGIITQTILDTVDLKTPLLIFENDTSFHPQLMRYHNTILYDNAFLLSSKLNTLREGVDIVYCGLPLLNFSDAQVDELLNQIYDVLKPGGKLICFQYTPLLFRKFNKVFNKCYLTFVFLNIPPAFVFTCVKE
ncbi:class I SAM-dependent methyltransferase [Anaerobacillus isosaccharinicus]|uniref:Class I SAM-dependent methyltransferase n=1 Tax=Anaerobacillus isosaccharinicus TaxID=1532552 RepID=A0A1S2LIB0_9BACI|nr:class I SAM-dependent methyltransferase [Anaerobacillus isosaccharinicus]MBA5584733.1 class I SAM-dependent methyltransferase [Anaerobacillus isosaccharinicus]QOY36898.1 class I SAM-dependent methyltransferase [Anaerobacillus isosaccharinicus]